MAGHNVIKRIYRQLIIFLMVTALIFPEIALAYDPMTTASLKIENIMFGKFGMSISAIIIGATFLLAKTGKITWDRFIFIGLCTAGFLGSQSIVNTVRGCVG